MLERLAGTSGASGKLIDLATNTNPIGASPRAISAAARAVAHAHRYPDPGYPSLRGGLSAHLRVAPEEIVLGNGSDGIIQLLGCLLLERDTRALVSKPAFSRYADAATLNRAECGQVPLTELWAHDLDEMSRRVDGRTRLVFITNPHNPTGTILSRRQVTRFLDSVREDVVVAFDEAYHEYAAGAADYADALTYVREGRPNVVVLRTMSKVYALAGLRVGYGVMSRGLAARCERYRPPFNIAAAAEAAAVAALADRPHVEETLNLNEEGKRYLYSAFAALGLEYVPTYANFIWVDVVRGARKLAEALAERNILVLPGDIFDAPTHIRVSVGRPEHNAAFARALGELL